MYLLSRASNEDSNQPARCSVVIVRMMKFSFFAVLTAPSEDSEQTARMRKRIKSSVWRIYPKVRFQTLRLKYTVYNLKWLYAEIAKQRMNFAE